MKFVMNGALTIGTPDVTNIEIKNEVGDDNIFIFGPTAAQAEELRGRYNPRGIYESDKEIHCAIDLLQENFFSLAEPGIFQPIVSNLLEEDYFYLNLADFGSFVDTQARVEALYHDQEKWSEKAILNVARSGKFSSDRTIAEYAHTVWNVKPVDVSRPR